MCLTVIPPRIYDSYDIHVYQAAKGMNASYDALVDLLESIERFLMRLDIYTHIPHTPALDEIAVKIIVELLSTLALVTKELKQGRMSKSTPIEEVPPYSIHAEKFAKKLFGEKDIEVVLQRLDRLTQDEAYTTAVEIFKVIHGLVQNVNGVMDGK